MNSITTRHQGLGVIFSQNIGRVSRYVMITLLVIAALGALILIAWASMKGGRVSVVGEQASFLGSHSFKAKALLIGVITLVTALPILAFLLTQAVFKSSSQEPHIQKAVQELAPVIFVTQALCAPLSGKCFLQPEIKVGEKVEEGRIMGKLEAMKMEHMLRAPCSGKVLDILVGHLTIVNKGTEIFRIEKEISE